MNHVAYWLGLTDPNKPPYLFWSGVFSDIQKFAIAALGVKVWRQHHHHMRHHF